MNFFDYIENFTGPGMTFFEYIFPILIIAIAIGFAVVFRNKLNDKTKNNILRTIGALFLVGEISFRIWLIYHKQPWYTNVPLHLCSINALVGAYFLLFKLNNINKRVFGVWFILAAQGAFLATIYSQMAVGFSHFRYWEYYLIHILLVIAPIFVLLFKNIIPTKKDAINALITMIILYIPVVIFNTIFNTTYMYISFGVDPRPGGTLLSLMGPHPWYMLSMVLSAPFVIALTYLPIYLIFHRK